MSKRSHELYVVYLQAAHLFPGQKADSNPPLLCLCALCHHYFDRPRKQGKEAIADWTFIGQTAARFIEEEALEQERQRIADQVDLADYVASCIEQRTDNRTGENNGNDAG